MEWVLPPVFAGLLLYISKIDKGVSLMKEIV